jgi:hypothetical protein
MRGTGIDSEVEIYAMKQSNEHRYMEFDLSHVDKGIEHMLCSGGGLPQSVY